MTQPLPRLTATASSQAITLLHWQMLGEVAEVIGRLSEPLDRACEHRSPEMARACVLCLRDSAKAAIASFNEIEARHE